MAIRTTKIELFGFCGVGKECNKDRLKAWRQLATYMQHVQNRIWQLWLIHHTTPDQDGNTSIDKIRDFYDTYRVWAESKKIKKPELNVHYCSYALKEEIRKAVSKEFAEVSCRTINLQIDKWHKTLKTRKATTGNKSGWCAILLAQESLPSHTRPIPIPFDNQNGSIFFDGKDFCISVRIERLPREGMRATTVEDTCKLMLRKRKANSQRQIIQRITSGEYKYKGSGLLYNPKRNKWFALISYEMPDRKEVELDAFTVMYVIPAKNKSPWILKIVNASGRTRVHRYGGTGGSVEHVRKMIDSNRSGMKESHRWAGSTRKGRGRKRATIPWTKLSSRWKDYTKSCNQKTTSRIVQKCLAERIGKVVYYQPEDDRRLEMFLSKAGNRPGSGMLWDWFQFGTLLSYKCNHHGIAYETKKIPARQGSVPSNGVRNGVRKHRESKPQQRPQGKSSVVS